MADADVLNPVHARHSLPSGRRLYADGGGDRARASTVLPPASERWSLRVELKDEDIARLYAQGLTRGALVWREGMPEWRPLLITPELSQLLHRTPIALRNVSDPALEDEVTLPRPARLPPGLGGDKAASDGKDVPTVAPTALDVPSDAVSTNQPRRRRLAELAAVAVLSFGMAWYARGTDEPVAAAPEPQTAAVPAATAALPALAPASAPLLASGSLIPIVALTDLPVLDHGARSGLRLAAHRAPARHRPTAPASNSGDGPSRAQLMAALGQVANVASGCGERSGPVRVVIAFAPSGVARSIQVSGKELPSQVRACIIGAASRARVASFSGDPVTVSKTL